MLEVISSSLFGFWFGLLGQAPAPLEAVVPVSWEEAEIFVLPTEPDPTVEAIVEEYLQRLQARGIAGERQGIWLQSEWAELARHQETTPAPAASLTKIATTLAALSKWGLDHQFVTAIYATGPLEHGVLQGDLVVQGSGDPLFVWEEAIALGNALEELGIRQVQGNLVIVGKLAMNFKSDPLVAGQLLQQGLNSRLWPAAVQEQYRRLPPGTPRPSVAIAGKVQLRDSLAEGSQLLLQHKSLTLADLLKQMNIYSNNAMSEMLAQGVGGAAVVAQVAAEAADIAPAEIQFVNGSGLSVDNRLSPRAAANLFIALERQLAGSAVKVADLFPVAGRDRQGTMQWRSIPPGIAIKTGTLAQVSALAGVIPTQERGHVWFAILNRGGNIEKFRAEQDRLLQRLAQHWQLVPDGIATQTSDRVYLGDPSRNLQGE